MKCSTKKHRKPRRQWTKPLERQHNWTLYKNKPISVEINIFVCSCLNQTVGQMFNVYLYVDQATGIVCFFLHMFLYNSEQNNKKLFTIHFTNQKLMSISCANSNLLYFFTNPSLLFGTLLNALLIQEVDNKLWTKWYNKLTNNLRVTQRYMSEYNSLFIFCNSENLFALICKWVTTISFSPFGLYINFN